MIYIGNTDHDWFHFLAQQGDLEEINFWRPGGGRRFRVLRQGELFLFRLKSPVNMIAGGGWFEWSDQLPISAAWDYFGRGNGVASLEDLLAAIERYRRRPIASPYEDVGNVILRSPFFFDRADWIPLPADWSTNIVQGKSYSVDSVPGRVLLNAVTERLGHTLGRANGDDDDRAAGSRTSEKAGVYEVPGGVVATMSMRRIGQGAFRGMVLQTYERRCALTGGKVLPVLEAAHIKPFAHGGPHHVTNGILMRSDVHALFDLGYLTVTRELKIQASARLKDEFNNGDDYRRLHGNTIWVPSDPTRQPRPELLEWHSDTVFKG